LKVVFDFVLQAYLPFFLFIYSIIRVFFLIRDGIQESPSGDLFTTFDLFRQVKNRKGSLSKTTTLRKGKDDMYMRWLREYSQEKRHTHLALSSLWLQRNINALKTHQMALKWESFPDGTTNIS
jgi:hypothetical protein